MKEQILEKALESAPATGWSMATLREAAKACGQKPQVADALFGNLAGANAALSNLFDARMMKQLKSIDLEKMRIRDRIFCAVHTRLDLMAPYREAMKLTHAKPGRTIKPLWRASDKIWIWAGDTATDYNHYTKRALLSGVMAATYLFWLQDNSPNFTATGDFLNRRIDNVLKIGKFIGALKGKIAA